MPKRRLPTRLPIDAAQHPRLTKTSITSQRTPSISHRTHDRCFSANIATEQRRSQRIQAARSTQSDTW